MLWKLREESRLKEEARLLWEAPDIAGDDYIIQFDVDS